jgi:hypothetical protein
VRAHLAAPVLVVIPHPRVSARLVLISEFVISISPVWWHASSAGTLARSGRRRSPPAAQERHRDGLTQSVLEKHTCHAVPRFQWHLLCAQSSLQRLLRSVSYPPCFLRSHDEESRGQTYKIYLAISNCSPPDVHVVSGLGGAGVLQYSELSSSQRGSVAAEWLPIVLSAVS